jgi:hypothetical protein
MSARSSTPDLGSARHGGCANRSAGFREETAIPRQHRVDMVSVTAAFLIQPIRREGVMRTILAVAVVLLGCLASAARAETTTAPSPANPQVNIQQPEPALPMPRPRVRHPDPPVKTAAVKRSSRPDRQRRSRRHQEKPKQAVRATVEAKAKSPSAEAKAKSPSVEAKAKSPSVEAKAKSPAAEAKAKSPAAETKAPHRTLPARDQKTVATDATSAVQPALQEKPPEMPPVAVAPPPPVANTVPQQEESATLQSHAPEADADQQQTATASPQATANDQEERTVWWTREGSPAVVRFRDCIAAFAVRNIGKNNGTSWADLLIRAAENECRQTFDEMARTLSARLGPEATEPVIRSLIETTFLPAARKAVSSTQHVAGGKSDPVPSAPAPAH